MMGLNDAFTVNVFYAGVAVSVSKRHCARVGPTINVSIPELKCVLKEVASHVGNVSVDQLQGLVSLAEGIVVPMINVVEKLNNYDTLVRTYEPH